MILMGMHTIYNVTTGILFISSVDTSHFNIAKCSKCIPQIRKYSKKSYVARAFVVDHDHHQNLDGARVTLSYLSPQLYTIICQKDI